MSAPRKRRWLRRLVLGTTFLAGVAVVVLAAHAYRTLPLRSVEVSGAIRADTAQVIRLAALPDSTVLSAVDPRLVADRVQRHPWVHTARVRRLPTGTLEIRLQERAPAALVLGADGRPRHFLDSEGHALPLIEGVVYDVPLLRGAVPDAPATRPVQDAELVQLLEALDAASPEIDALVSEIAYQRGSAVLRTPPVSGHPALTVLLGSGSYPDKLERLRAFYDQAVLSRPGHAIHVIDLRFDGQVVTREAPPAGALAANTDPTEPLPSPTPTPP
jgi:cell division protein FtsQ